MRADYGQSDYNLPIANVTSLVYELPFGRGRSFLANANGLTDAVLGGWQISAHQHHAGGHAVQHYLLAELGAAGVAADFGNVPRRQRVPARSWCRARR